MKTTNKKTLRKGFATTSLEDSTTAGHKGREARGNGAGVLDARVSGSMITNRTRSAD